MVVLSESNVSNVSGGLIAGPNSLAYSVGYVVGEGLSDLRDWCTLEFMGAYAGMIDSAYGA